VGDLEAALGHSFHDQQLLTEALTHRSLEAESHTAVSNERLEFLGDAVLGLVIADALYRAGGLDEGDMAKVRAAVVDTGALAEVARAIELGPHLMLGRGEAASGGADKSSILADALEAVIGALYIDGGLEPAQAFILEHWDALVSSRAEAPGQRDYKTRLQEAWASYGLIPEYRVEGWGPDHDRRFRATVFAGDEELGSGEGTSKKRAEQAAARQALGRGVPDA